MLQIKVILTSLDGKKKEVACIKSLRMPRKKERYVLLGNDYVLGWFKSANQAVIARNENVSHDKGLNFLINWFFSPHLEAMRFDLCDAPILGCKDNEKAVS